MAEKSKTREITLVDKSGTFHYLRKHLIGENEEFDFDALSAIRKILSNEKARLLYTIKTKKPNSIYQLAKILKRDFKSVDKDIKLLERFGFIDMVAERTGKRERLKPVLIVDTIHIHIKV